MAVEFYRYSYKTAKSDNCVDLYKESKAENMRCCKYIQDKDTGFYANAYENNCVDSDRAYTKALIKEFGMERVMSIYAQTLKQSITDGRISPEVKEWAKSFNAGLRHNEDKSDLHLSGLHIGVINILAKNAIEEYEALNLFSKEHCEEKLGDLEDKVIVLNPNALKEEYRTPENQLWLATGGFGCSPSASGRAVYAICLGDGEEHRWNRENVLGILKPEFMPDWAKEKLEEIQNPDENIGMELK